MELLSEIATAEMMAYECLTVKSKVIDGVEGKNFACSQGLNVKRKQKIDLIKFDTNKQIISDILSCIVYAIEHSQVKAKRFGACSKPNGNGFGFALPRSPLNRQGPIIGAMTTAAVFYKFPEFRRVLPGTSQNLFLFAIDGHDDFDANITILNVAGSLRMLSLVNYRTWFVLRNNGSCFRNVKNTTFGKKIIVAIPTE